MITRDQYEFLCKTTEDYLGRAGIVLTGAERGQIEVADFGLGEVESQGLEIITYVNTARCCAKELVMLPMQTCPEHLHPPVDGEPGKEETFRCRWGTVYLYVDGPPTQSPSGVKPVGSEQHYKVAHEVVLHPGDQHTIFPGTAHWFQAGPEGAVVSEFSTRSRDESDTFTDPRIMRAPEVV